jgi:hypothetical protein
VTGLEPAAFPLLMSGSPDQDASQTARRCSIELHRIQPFEGICGHCLQQSTEISQNWWKAGDKTRGTGSITLCCAAPTASGRLCFGLKGITFTSRDQVLRADRAGRGAP